MEPEVHLALGIDVGGTGIKAGVVDVATGRMVTDRLRVDTPHPANPKPVCEAIAALVEPVAGEGHYEAVGVGFPSVIKRGIAMTAVHLAEEWCFADVETLVAEAVDADVVVMNDADAAGLAEIRFGAGEGVDGTVVVVTLGTGVGTSLFTDGCLVPNMELGRALVRGKPASERISRVALERKKLGWDEWAEDLQLFLTELEEIARPELIVIGGGISEESHRFIGDIKVRAQLMPACLRNSAGIIGAATRAWDLREIPKRQREIAPA